MIFFKKNYRIFLSHAKDKLTAELLEILISLKFNIFESSKSEKLKFKWKYE